MDIVQTSADITLITPTGHRPEAFALCQQWMARQSFRGQVQWIVVSDEVPFRPERCSLGQLFVGRWPKETDGTHTLAANLLAALPHVQSPRVLIIEDDDWYASDYVEWMVRLLERADLAGEGRSIYYRWCQRLWKRCNNRRHASLFQTGMNVSVLPIFEDVCRLCADRGSPFVDVRLWRRWGGSRHVECTDTPHAVGLKELPGRRGLTSGWRGRGHGWRSDPHGCRIRELLGPDVDLVHGVAPSLGGRARYQELEPHLDGEMPAPPSQRRVQVTEQHACYSSADRISPCASKVSIVIPCYNRLRLTKKAIASIRERTAWVNIELICVNDGSADGTAAWLAEQKRTGTVDHVVHHARSRGLATAMNEGWAQATGAYLMKLDNDVEIRDPLWIERMMQLFEAFPELGVTSVKIAPGAIRRRLKSGAVTADVPRGNLNGACLLIPRDVFSNIGFCRQFSRGYGLMDADYCRRVRQAGYRLAYVPGRKGDIAVHLQHESSDEEYDCRKREDRQVNRREWRRVRHQNPGFVSFQPQSLLALRPEEEAAFEHWRQQGHRMGMAISRLCWAVIRDQIYQRNVLHSLETGSGLSTLLFSQSPVRYHVALEQASRWRKECAKAIGSGSPCSIAMPSCHLAGDPPWYVVPEQLVRPVDLIVIDGPIGRIGRDGAVAGIEPWCHRHTVIIVDDTHRAAERAIADSIAERRLMKGTYYFDQHRGFTFLEPLL